MGKSGSKMKALIPTEPIDAKKPNRREMCAQIDAAVKAGTDLTVACEQVGMTVKNYQSAKSYFKYAAKLKQRTTSKPQPELIQVDDTDDDVKIVIMKGKSSTIEAIARSLGGLM